MNIERIRTFCLSLPSVSEDVKWENDLVFSVAGKMFCVCALDVVPLKASFKVRGDQFDELCSSEGVGPAPYMARHGWVMVSDPARFADREWKTLIRQSYDLVVARLSKARQAKL